MKYLLLKGQCHEIFDFWFFSWISFPQAPEYITGAFSNFFENSRRYSQLMVHHRCRWHRWQMKKIFTQKNFNNFVATPLDSRVNIYMNFCLQLHLEVSAAWYFLPLFAIGVNDTGGKFAAGVVDTGGKLPPVSLTTLANLPPVSLILGKLVAKFAAGVVDTGDKFATGVVDTGGAPWLANYSANFWKNSKRS